ncbi:MAG: polysaccharide deacetylase family protein [Saprospiraceae bacterium]|nr:polysaccharide deacetylase family protein [Saprospiraceae bacterium]
MAGYRENFLQLSSFFTKVIPGKSLFSRKDIPLVHVFYHTVADHTPPHIQHLYPVKSIGSFKKDLDFILEHFVPLDIKDFKPGIKQKNGKPFFILSFDDGLREFSDVISPILLEKGVPATCFLNPEFVGNKGLFFRYKASLLVDHVLGNRIQPEVQDWNSWVGDLNVKGSFEASLLNLGYDRRQVLDFVAQKLELSFSDYLEKKRPYLDEMQIRSLIAKGFTFGAHSLDHPEYRFLEQVEQIRQTKDSVDWVVEKFSLPYRYFAFPFTDFQVSNTFFEQVQREEIAEMTFGGAGLKYDSVDFHHQRIPMEVGRLSAEEILKGEMLYYNFKALFGKNTLTRE